MTVVELRSTSLLIHTRHPVSCPDHLAMGHLVCFREHNYDIIRWLGDFAVSINCPVFLQVKPPGDEAIKFWEGKVSTMAADALAPCVARSLSVVMLTAGQTGPLLWKEQMDLAKLLAAIVLSTIGRIAKLIWVRSRRCGCFVTWFCYHLIAKPGNKTAAHSWPHPYS